jgi:hypothetical protein
LSGIRLLVTLALSLLLAACSGAWVPFSSGAITDARPAPIPADWSDVGATNIIQLETNPAEPYTVNLWVVAMDDALYVHAGANRTSWVEHIEADPAVRLACDGSIYELEASRVTDADEFARFSEVYRDKYGNYPRNRTVGEVYAFRLTPRS